VHLDIDENQKTVQNQKRSEVKAKRLEA